MPSFARPLKKQRTEPSVAPVPIPRPKPRSITKPTTINPFDPRMSRENICDFLQEYVDTIHLVLVSECWVHGERRPWKVEPSMLLSHLQSDAGKGSAVFIEQIMIDHSVMTHPLLPKILHLLNKGEPIQNLCISGEKTRLDWLTIPSHDNTFEKVFINVLSNLHFLNLQGIDNFPVRILTVCNTLEALYLDGMGTFPCPRTTPYLRIKDDESFYNRPNLNDVDKAHPITILTIGNLTDSSVSSFRQLTDTLTSMKSFVGDVKPVQVANGNKRMLYESQRTLDFAVQPTTLSLHVPTYSSDIFGVSQKLLSRVSSTITRLELTFSALCGFENATSLSLHNFHQLEVLKIWIWSECDIPLAPRSYFAPTTTATGEASSSHVMISNSGGGVIIDPAHLPANGNGEEEKVVSSMLLPNHRHDQRPTKTMRKKKAKMTTTTTTTTTTTSKQSTYDPIRVVTQLVKSIPTTTGGGTTRPFTQLHLTITYLPKSSGDPNSTIENPYGTWHELAVSLCRHLPSKKTKNPTKMIRVPISVIVDPTLFASGNSMNMFRGSKGKGKGKGKMDLENLSTGYKGKVIDSVMEDLSDFSEDKFGVVEFC